MFRFHRVSRSAAALAVAIVVGSCSSDDEVLGPELRGANAIFQNYVAIGNSITAGFQSSGISDATQKQSYALLLATQMRTRFAYPSLAAAGCPAPINNFQTQTRPANPGNVPCALRNPASATDILNSVAVPNASSYDPTGIAPPPPIVFSNALTTLFLGGKTQVQKALQANPTFVSIWIGNNDVLGFAVQDGRTTVSTPPAGLGLAGMTSVATFQSNYDAMINQLTTGAPGLKGVLVGVVQVANAPIMFSAAFLSNAAFKVGFDAVACGTAAAPAPTSPCAATGFTILDASCLAGGAGATSLINTFLAFQIRIGAIPSPLIACVPGGASGLIPPPIGDILVLDPTEQATISARINAYNAHIQTKATALNFAYVDPNPLLIQLKGGATPLISTFPNYGSATAPFGIGMSLDGVHPAGPVHREIANALVTAINAKYSTTLSPVP